MATHFFSGGGSVGFGGDDLMKIETLLMNVVSEHWLTNEEPSST